MKNPTHGFTKTGKAVHAKVMDHMPTETRYQRLNKRAALWIVSHVFTMTTFWLFCLLAICSLPAVLSAFPIFVGVFPAFIIKPSVIALVAWVAQTFIQLVMLPAIGAGQALQNASAEARSAKQFEDTEVILDRLDANTEGGIADVLDAIKAQSKGRKTSSSSHG